MYNMNKSGIKQYTLKKEVTNFPKEKLNSATKTAKFLRQFYGDDLEIYESFFMLTLDRGLNTTGFVKVSQGGITATVVDKVMVTKYAIESMASCVVLCHNHPSGALKPSEQDKRLTNELVKCLGLFGITVVDHIILTADSFYSFANEGEL